jgi:teichoic acid transport system permease protein
LIVYLLYGYTISPYILQVIYYSFAMMVFTIGLIYLTSALCVFFKDMAQLVNIFLQVGIWATPIMWNYDAMMSKLSPALRMVLELNPMYYITSGYRESFIGQTAFWNRPLLGAYFWGLTLVIYTLGTHVFKKLQPQFADAL